MWLSLCAFGLAQGMRHALEPDHLAAVSTLASDSRSATRVLGYATLWGLGHATMLLVVGGALFAARGVMPEPLTAALEVGVAIMLVVLGVRSISQALRMSDAAHAQDHAHGAPLHVHLGGRTVALLPFGVGLVHGLAGSGALAALVMATQPELERGLAMLAVYALGTVLGMALLAGVLGKPLQLLTQHVRARRLVVGAAGVLSLIIGVWWGITAVRGEAEAADHASLMRLP